MANSIHQESVIAMTPDLAYATLTDAERFRAMTGGAPAEIDATPGGAFSCFGGMILGRNIECVPGERLVQAWRVKTWEPGIYSMVRFEFRSEGEVTRVILDHTGFPEDEAEHLASGWHTNYWEPLRKSFPLQTLS